MGFSKQQIQNWIKQIQKDQIDSCLEELCKDIHQFDEDQQKIIISLSARLSEQQKKENLGTSSHEEETVEKGKIRLGLLNVLMDMQDELIAAQQEIRTVQLVENEAEFRQLLEATLPSGKYTNLKCISTGDYCLVYSALRNRESGFREKVAIKVFKNLSLIDQENVQELAERFTKSRQYSSLDGIITILDDNLKHPPRYYVMPYVDGMRLSDRLRLDWPLQQREIKKVLLKITEALIQGHQDDLLHLNLRPSNIMIDREGEPQIFPFQVIRFNVSQRSVGRIKQIVAYWSPEQINGQELTEKSDQYALGLVAFELFKHQPFFRGDTVLEVLRKRIKFGEAPEILAEELADTHCPEPMIRVIQRMLSHRPEDRYTDLEEVWDELDTVRVNPKHSGSKTMLRQLRKSFDRCRKQEDFYHSFYQHFFEKSPNSKAIFEKHFQIKGEEKNQSKEALWEYQHRVLDLAIDRLLTFYDNPQTIQNRLATLAENHRTLGIPLTEFTTFMDSLKTAILAKDAKSWMGKEKELEKTWKGLHKVINKSITP